MTKFIEVVHSESHNELKLENHFHNSYEIIYIVEGQSRFLINDKEYYVSAGSLIFINNFENHNVEVIQFPYKRYFILIDPMWFQSIINDPLLISVFKNRPPHFKHFLSLDNCSKHIVNKLFHDFYIEFTNKSVYWELMMKSYIQKLFVLLFRDYCSFFPLKLSSSSVELIFKIQKYIEEHCTEDISLKMVAELFFIDMYYLSRLFKQNTGFTFKEYLILHRISKAKELLFYTNDSITNVCINSGFNSVNHFIRIFKKYTNTTPLKYRNLYRRII